MEGLDFDRLNKASHYIALNEVKFEKNGTLPTWFFI